jgi:hypothetical protein
MSFLEREEADTRVGDSWKVIRICNNSYKVWEKESSKEVLAGHGGSCL